jgi:quercetin dioxygenase-like cupin family protein
MKPPVNVEDIKWGPAPPAIPPGAPLAVVAGDPGKEGLFTMRLKMPANYKVPAHHHLTDEFVTVISGDFRVGLGDKLDMDKGQSLKAGAFGEMPAGMNHYAWTTEETVVQIAGPGAVRYHLRQPGRRPEQTGHEIAGE